MSEDLRRKVLSGLLWTVIQNCGGKVITLVLFSILARLLDPHEFGVFASAMAVLGFVALFVEQGLSEAIVQRPVVTPRLLNTAFVVNLALALLVFTLLWFASPLIAKNMDILELTGILRAASLSILVSALAFSQQAMQRRNFHYRWLAICAFSSTLVSGIMGTILALTGHGAWSLVAQSVIAAAIYAALLWIRSQWAFSFEFDFAGVRSLFGYGMNMLGQHISYFGNTRYIEIFLATTFGVSALGSYLVGVKIYQALMQALSSSILEVAYSGFSRVAHDRAAIVRAYFKAITLTSAVAVPIFVLLACVAPEVTVVFFGEKWRQSADIMRPMALLGAGEVLEFYNGTVYNALGRPFIGFLFNAFKTLIILTTLWLSRHVVFATIIWWYIFGQLLSMPPSFIFARKLIGISFRSIASRIWPFLAGCVVASAVISMLRANALLSEWHPIYRLFVLSSVGTLTYLGFVGLAAREQVHEMVTMLKGRQYRAMKETDVTCSPQTEPREI
jgi:O-antigen/teichoic acid export membrane protein